MDKFGGRYYDRHQIMARARAFAKARGFNISFQMLKNDIKKDFICFLLVCKQYSNKVSKNKKKKMRDRLDEEERDKS